jgi:PAS domain S-box-containing protein
VWSEDAPGVAAAPRDSAPGFGARCVVPIGVDFAEAGLIELLSRERRPVADALLASLDPLGSEIGQFVRRRAAEQQSREALGLLEAVTEGTTDGVYVYDLEGRYLMINSAAAALLGRTRAEVIGRTQRALFPEADALRLEQSSAETLAAGTARTMELELTVNGEVRTYHTTHAVWRDAEGQAIGICGIARDITERKRLELQFLQSQRLEAVGQLAGGIAHDFNNLLTVILGYTSVAATQLGPEHPLQSCISECTHAGESAAALTRQLLAFSRQQVLSVQPLDLNEVVDAMDQMLRSLIGESFTFETVKGDGLWTVQADRGQIEQVAMNLMVNARDAMPGGGRLRLETGNAEVDAPVPGAVEPIAPGSYATLAVADTGTGLDDETRARMFEPFFTTKPRGKGTGLGLATVFGIVKQSGGSIAVDSAPGRGSRFTVYLPRVEMAPEPAMASSRHPIAGGSESILLVEDQAAVRDLMRRLLEKLGYEVLVADCPEDAIAAVRARVGTLDLLVTDVVMPSMSGPKLAERVHELDGALRVLYVSGYAHETMSVEGELGRDAHFLPKPFTLATLGRKVRDVLEAAA